MRPTSHYHHGPHLNNHDGHGGNGLHHRFESFQLLSQVDLENASVLANNNNVGNPSTNGGSNKSSDGEMNAHHNVILGSEDDRHRLNEDENNYNNNNLNFDSENSSNDLRTVTAGALTLRDRLLMVLDDPLSSKTAMVVNIILAGFIFISAAVLAIETLPQFYKQRQQWLIIETVIVIVFSFEFLIRSWAAIKDLKTLWIYLKNPLTLVDILAIVPYFIPIITQHTLTNDIQVFSIFRLLRLFRIVNMLSPNSLFRMSVEVMFQAAILSLESLVGVFSFIIMIIIVFSTLLYIAERGTYSEELEVFVDSNKNPSQFSSIPAAFWYCTSTLTTLGLGDMVPQTVLGKVFSFFCIICGLIVITLPSMVVGRNFSVLWEAARERLENSKKEKLSAVHTASSLPDVLATGIVEEENNTKNSIAVDASPAEVAAALRLWAAETRYQGARLNSIAQWLEKRDLQPAKK